MKKIRTSLNLVGRFSFHVALYVLKLVQIGSDLDIAPTQRQMRLVSNSSCDRSQVIGSGSHIASIVFEGDELTPW